MSTDNQSGNPDLPTINIGADEGTIAAAAAAVPPLPDTPAAAAPVAEAPPAETPTATDLDTEPEAAPQVIRTNPNVTMERPVIEEETKRHRHTIPVPLIPRSLSEFSAMNDAMANSFEELGSSQAGAEWMLYIFQGQRHYAAGEVLVGAAARESSDWGQVVEYNGTRLTAGVPPMGGSGQKLTGAKAAMAMRSGMGLASAISFPLWHSGIWLTTAAPMDSELMVLMHQLMNEKIDLGNQTAGMAFSNGGVFTAEKLVDFILGKVYQQNVADPDPETLKKQILVTDLWSMAWGMALTIYPHGFTHRAPCIDDPHKSNHVGEYHLNLARLHWVDRSSLNPEQKRHMSVRKATYTQDDIKKYQGQGRLCLPKTIQINDTLSVTLQTPSLWTWFEAGKRWIRSIEETVEKGFGSNLSTKQKNDYFAEQSILSFLRQYSHWVSAITFNDVEYDDPESIDQMLSALSEDADVPELFLNEVKKYIDEVTVAMVALPSYNCPKCNLPQTDEESAHPEIIPLDPLQVFFTLADHRTRRARTDSTNG